MDGLTSTDIHICTLEKGGGERKRDTQRERETGGGLKRGSSYLFERETEKERDSGWKQKEDPLASLVQHTSRFKTRS